MYIDVRPLWNFVDLGWGLQNERTGSMLSSLHVYCSASQSPDCEGQSFPVAERIARRGFYIPSGMQVALVYDDKSIQYKSIIVTWYPPLIKHGKGKSLICRWFSD